MKVLPRVTLVIVDCVNYGKAVCSLRESLKHITPSRTVFFTDNECLALEDDRIEIVIIERIQSKEDYSKFIIKELHKYLRTEFVLITQHDGFCLTDKWDDDFFNYDVIGAKWLYTDGRNCGNGGFTLRSRTLQTIVGTDPIIDVYDPEDAVIGRLYRRYLEVKYAMKFAPDEVCDRFSFELNEPTNETLGFHSYFWPPYQPTIMITREAALGDVVACEPILRYYHEKGYRVVLNTLPQFENLFIQHDFKVFFPRDLHPDLKYTEISLDMAYEVQPQKNHLQAYYETCGITDGPMRSPRLTLDFDVKREKLFPKYCILHIDERQPGRNIYGVYWPSIVRLLNAKGFTVVQIGRGQHEEVVGAVQMNLITEAMMLWGIGGADLFIGIDSGPANIAVAMGTPAILFSGSVDLRLIHPDMSNIVWLHNHDKNPCEKSFCWHRQPGVQGVECYVDELNPPCVQFSTDDVFKALDKIIRQCA